MDEAQVPELEVTLLKGISVSSRDQLIKLPQQQGHLVFAMLADAPGTHLVRDHQLLDRLWDGDTSKRGSLRTAVSRMRLPLGDDRIIRSKDPAGYQFRIWEGERVDLWVWWEMLTACSRLSTIDPRAAALALPAPLAMCSLGALEELPDTLAMRALRDGIVTDYLQGASQLAELQLALGDHRATIAWLPDLVRDHTGWEHLRALLMTALYREQRVAEALALYDDLAAFLGHQPGPEVSQIRAKILDDSDTSLLEVVPPPVLPADQAVAASGGGTGTSLGRISSHHHSMDTGPDAYTTAADRAAIVVVRTIVPHIVVMSEEASLFAEHAARKAAERGIGKILVLAEPLPHTLHSVARRVSPGGTRVVYTHYDQALVKHASRLHQHDPHVDCVHATMAQPEKLMQVPEVREILQLDRPLAERAPTLMIDTYNLNLIPIARDVKSLYQLVIDELAPGSIVAMSINIRDDMSPVVRRQLTAFFAQDDLAKMPVVSRSRAEFEALIPDGLEIQPPGITDVYRLLAANLPPDRQVERRDPWLYYGVLTIKR
ncbi:SAM-dependent methyltransferase [Spirillospora sp. CA-294931]|uniref:SAM-dependent methyltransferase n=1 Tax=Spirillospora sp. CA-294931 TaxID=3240042 RepID=UPI003D941AB2